MTLDLVLEQAPRRAGVPGGQSIRDALSFAQHVDRLGYTRFWVAEHHAMGGVGQLGAGDPDRPRGGGHPASARRLGGGAAAQPPPPARRRAVPDARGPTGRIDLGIGRSEGATDEAIVRAFTRPDDSDHGAGFDEQLDQLLAFGGVGSLPEGHPLAGVRAGPDGVGLPPVYLLGSSLRSAETAARRGLGYGFAAYTNPDAFADALRLYRRRFVPSPTRDRPHAILGLKWSAATTRTPARWRSRGIWAWSDIERDPRGR